MLSVCPHFFYSVRKFGHVADPLLLVAPGAGQSLSVAKARKKSTRAKAKSAKSMQEETKMEENSTSPSNDATSSSNDADDINSDDDISSGDDDEGRDEEDDNPDERGVPTGAGMKVSNAQGKQRRVGAGMKVSSAHTKKPRQMACKYEKSSSDQAALRKAKEANIQHDIPPLPQTVFDTFEEFTDAVTVYIAKHCLGYRRRTSQSIERKNKCVPMPLHIYQSSNLISSTTCVCIL
jgi:hypothetical protein